MSLLSDLEDLPPNSRDFTLLASLPALSISTIFMFDDKKAWNGRSSIDSKAFHRSTDQTRPPPSMASSHRGVFASQLTRKGNVSGVQLAYDFSIFSIWFLNSLPTIGGLNYHTLELSSDSH